ncbi:hypothetical protein TOT_010000141 [Theileria orientalis strain Shintoku]|uniref:Uncharacterized protein n=1 Tax=Theileria orientalis strain Shintoku TaxID=869250 RepID=J7MEQ4_THEOR|nr:hypothetical protein TOT_010000141 [Theileria orientalis strain Shintoku]PVC54253.1 hypothetical protein MACL_00003221 [Theileria orientalis]BAM38674.1 hypothetical protein TOT_010000141 [Theileria orientalis strain Shintoku]|eukprot:XP_009688975.1 hypothetical protein TOT_010000141 [Theileria orientalis strain Shintoku]
MLFQLYILILFFSTEKALTALAEFTVDQVCISLFKTANVLICYLRVLAATEFIRRLVFLGDSYRKTCLKKRDCSFEIKTRAKDDIELVVEEVVSDKELSIEGKLSAIYTIKSKIISNILFNNQRIDVITSQLLENENLSSHSKRPQLKDCTEGPTSMNQYRAVNKDLEEVYSKLKKFETEYELKICYRKCNGLVDTP